MGLVDTKTITLGATRFTFEQLGENLAMISAATIDASATNGGQMVLPIKEAERIWTSLEPESCWFIVSGRSHGDDDDSTFAYQVATRDEATDLFKADMRQNVKVEDYGDRDEDDAIYGWTVYINTIMKCATKPEIL